MILEDLVMDDNDEVVYLLVVEAIMIPNNNIKCMRYKALIDYHPTVNSTSAAHLIDILFTLTRSRSLP